MLNLHFFLFVRFIFIMLVSNFKKIKLYFTCTGQLLRKSGEVNIFGHSGKLSLTCRTFATTSDKPKTAIVMMNMGGPQNTDQVHDYLLRIMTDRDMIQLPVQRLDI